MFTGGSVSTGHAGVDGMFAFVPARYDKISEIILEHATVIANQISPEIGDMLTLGNEWLKWPNSTYNSFADYRSLPYPC